MVLLSTTLMVFAGIEIKVTYTDNTGTEITTSENFTSEAPLVTRISSNATELYEGASIIWRISNKASGAVVTRYEEETT